MQKPVSDKIDEKYQNLRKNIDISRMLAYNYIGTLKAKSYLIATDDSFFFLFGLLSKYFKSSESFDSSGWLIFLCLKIKK